MIKRRYFWQLLSLLVIDALLFSLTNTQSVASFMLIIGFVLLAATLHHLIYGLLMILEACGLTIKRKQQLASSITGVMSLLLALQSIGELSPRDVLVLLPLVVLGYFYGLYNAGSKQSPGA